MAEAFNARGVPNAHFDLIRWPLGRYLLAVPQAVVAQNEYAFYHQGQTGSLNCVYNSLEQCRQSQDGRSVGGRCVPNPATTGHGNVTPLGPPGGGQYLPPPSR